jgi:hypothetical protein
MFVWLLFALFSLRSRFWGVLDSRRPDSEGAECARPCHHVTTSQFAQTIPLHRGTSLAATRENSADVSRCSYDTTLRDCTPRQHGDLSIAHACTSVGRASSQQPMPNTPHNRWPPPDSMVLTPRSHTSLYVTSGLMCLSAAQRMPSRTRIEVPADACSRSSVHNCVDNPFFLDFLTTSQQRSTVQGKGLLGPQEAQLVPTRGSIRHHLELHRRPACFLCSAYLGGRGHGPLCGASHCVWLPPGVPFSQPS